MALQSSGAVHLGVDNLNVVRHVGCLLDGRPGSVPFELLKDGDLLLLIDRMLRLRGPDMVRVSKVKGHADEVLHGQVRKVDRIGNNAADEALQFLGEVVDAPVVATIGAGDGPDSTDSGGSTAAAPGLVCGLARCCARQGLCPFCWSRACRCSSWTRLLSCPLQCNDTCPCQFVFDFQPVSCACG